MAKPNSSDSLGYFFPSKGTQSSNNKRLEWIPDLSIFNEAHKCSMVLNEVSDPRSYYRFPSHLSKGKGENVNT